jgi:hypothetical protein
MIVRNISQAKAELSALIEEVQKAVRSSSPKQVSRLPSWYLIVAPIVPESRALKGQIWIAPDFDTLPDDMAELFGMKGPRR